MDTLMINLSEGHVGDVELDAPSIDNLHLTIWGNPDEHLYKRSKEGMCDMAAIHLTILEMRSVKGPARDQAMDFLAIYDAGKCGCKECTCYRDECQSYQLFGMICGDCPNAAEEYE